MVNRYRPYLCSFVGVPRSTLLMRKWREKKRLRAEKHTHEVIDPNGDVEVENINGTIQTSASGQDVEVNGDVQAGNINGAIQRSTSEKDKLNGDVEAGNINGSIQQSTSGEDFHANEDMDVQYLDDTEEGFAHFENGPQETDITAETINETAKAFLDEEENKSFKRKPPLCSHTKATPDDVIAMTFALGFRHDLSYVAMVDILKMVNALYGEKKVNATKYKFLKGLLTKENQDQNELKYHTFCQKCSVYIKKMSDVSTVCHLCKTDVGALKSPTYFASLSLESQLRKLVSNDAVAEMILHHRFSRNKVHADNLEDIYDGSEYKKMSSTGQILSYPQNFSFSFFVDGVPLGRRKKSLWPIYVTVNELPPQERHSNMMLVGLYYGSKDPDQTVFLQPFVAEANKLSSVGFTWKYKGCDVVSKVIPLVAVADSVARCQLLNMQTFHAYYGCTFCYQTTVRTVRRRKYARPSQPAEDRTMESYQCDMQQVFKRRFLTKDTDRQYRGVKGPSSLSYLNCFNLFTGFVVDYMHNILLGVCKFYFELIFCSTRRKCWDTLRDNEMYTTEDVMSAIDKRLLSIKPPSMVARTPRTISDYESWKANEWRSFLLFYCIPCLKGLLRKKYLNHLAMLSKAFFLLMQKSISNADVSEAHRLLTLFSDRFESFFGPEYMVYNVHLLQHVCAGVLRWGPLWTHNAFMYESFNRQLLQLCKSPYQVVKEVSKKYQLMKEMPRIIHLLSSWEQTSDFCEELLERRLVRFRRCGEYILLDAPKAANHLSIDSIEALVKFGIEIEQCLFYDRILFRGMRLSTAQYCVGKNHNDSCIFTSINLVYEVLSFLQTSANTLYILVRKINLTSRPIVKKTAVTLEHIERVESFGKLGIITPGEFILGQCIFFQNDTGTYCSKISVCIYGD